MQLSFELRLLALFVQSEVLFFLLRSRIVALKMNDRAISEIHPLLTLI